MSTLGRNDPCHCGSGKKYKKCHWNEDQKLAAERASQERARQAKLEALGTPSDAEMRTLYEKMTGRAAPAGPLPADAHNALVELWQQQRLIADARAVYEPEREQWERYFGENPDELDVVARELAADPMFENYELTDQNKAKVREELGELPGDDELSDYATRAIAMSLDEDDRANFNEAILSLLPELVEDGKLKEAYVVETCAARVLDAEAPLSPFLTDVVVRSMRPS